MSNLIDSLYKLNKKDLLKAGSVMGDAFRHDPLFLKLFEEQPDRENKFKAFFQVPVRYSLKYGEVYANSPNLEGLIAFVPGRFSVMTIWRMIRSGAILPGIKIGADLGKKMKPIFGILDTDRTENMKDNPFIYLQMLGVASEYQRKGFGGTLLRALIEKSEVGGVPLYLETETEENVSIYKKFGFKVIKQNTLPLIDLQMWEMVREV